MLASSASLALWYGVNFWPGWHAIPVLTSSASNLLSLVNLWLLAAAVSNAVFIVFDAKWFKSAWQIFVTTTAVALAARAYMEFPFDFSIAQYYDFRWVARLALMLAVIGGLVRLIVVGVRFLQAAMHTIDDILWTRQVKSTMQAKAYMAALARPIAPSDTTFDGASHLSADLGETSGSLARTVAGDPATNTLARFAELGGVLGDEAADAAPAADPHEGTGAGSGRETRRSRRAHASGGVPKLHVPRLGRRKAGSHAAH